jgi:hypothetical protein
LKFTLKKLKILKKVVPPTAILKLIFTLKNLEIYALNVSFAFLLEYFCNLCSLNPKIILLNSHLATLNLKKSKKTII